MEKKGAIWVSAILYFGLGLVVITIILTAGLPVIDKLKDKNIALNTKEIFQVLDTNIREVIRGGPGTQRVITLSIKKGEFEITNNWLIWSYDSKAFLSDPGTECRYNSDPAASSGTWVSEGNVKVCTSKTSEKGRYNINMLLEYSNIAELHTPEGMVNGIGDISIRNAGVNAAGNKIKLDISQA